LTALYQSTQGSSASWRQFEYYAQQIGSDPMNATFELGLYTFGDLMPETKAGKAVGAQQRVAEILAAEKLADVSSLDVFAVGEHHRLDMAISATPVVLAAIAAVTERIRVASAVTILSTADQRGVQWFRGCQ
jgi:alkanesulfonate monooxygenase SsuD/methylene tetrahydromethanopterin reductase-like flavin-dependent oxidoreductase (luciferase family)